MKLQTKLLILYAGSAIFITAVLGGILYTKLWDDRLISIQEDISKQLQQTDFILNNFFSEAESDVYNLVANEIVRSRDDRNFTSFLGADEKTFQYHIQPLEQKIIGLFNAYRTTHRYVNSVYMGRENGSFVRSHKRANPSRYDPRDRPWYILAKENPGKVMITDAYPSLTTADINIGIVKALVDEKGLFYGVVGIDITLNNLTDYIGNFKIKPAGKIFLTDGKGIVLAGEDKKMLYKKISDHSPELFKLLMENRQGVASLKIQRKENYVYYRTSTQQNWKIAVLIPAENIENEIRGPVIITIVGLSIGLLLLTVMTLIGLNVFVVRPLHKFVRETNYIAETSNLERRIEIHAGDEIGLLARSYNEMISALSKTKKSLEATGKELRDHRDHLEELVRERTLRLQEVNKKLSVEIEERIRREQELQQTLKELAVAREQAEAADNLKSAFLATMSHELRTPLNSIIGFTGIILRERVGPLNEEQKKQLNMVRRSSQHLLALINDVLDISKIEAGQLQVAIEKIDLRQVIEKAEQSTRPLADGKGLELGFEISAEIETITGDSRRVEQILLNLLSNAIKFTEKGSVRIVCEADDCGVVVKVIDTGMGIKAEDMETIFKSFRQIDSGISRKYEGTGLGLSISKKLVELMGGRIWVTSTWGSGSTFGFSLPKERKTV
jgi:signal transduction histidine kinase